MLRFRACVCFVGVSLMLGLVGCSSSPVADDTDTDADHSESPASGERVVAKFASPDAVLDALAEAMIEGDGQRYKEIVAGDQESLLGIDAIVMLQNDMPPEEAISINLKEIAKMQGHTGVLSKRFPPEIDGDHATIVTVFEDTGLFAQEDKFRKWKFVKVGNDQWQFDGSEFGDAKDLPSEYAWNKSIEDISEEMQDFIAFFDGTSDKVTEALAKHAPDVETDMDLYSIEKPVVTAKETRDGKDCYALTVVTGSIKRKFEICWQDGKIVSIDEQQ